MAVRAAGRRGAGAPPAEARLLLKKERGRKPRPPPSRGALNYWAPASRLRRAFALNRLPGRHRRPVGQTQRERLQDSVWISGPLLAQPELHQLGGAVIEAAAGGRRPARETAAPARLADALNTLDRLRLVLRIWAVRAVL